MKRRGFLQMMLGAPLLPVIAKEVPVPKTGPLQRGERVYIGKCPGMMKHFTQKCYGTIHGSHEQECMHSIHPLPFDVDGNDPNDYGIDIDGEGYNAWYPGSVLRRIK